MNPGELYKLVKAAVVVDDPEPVYKRPYSATVGRAIATIAHTLLFLRPDLGFRSPDKEMVEHEAKNVEKKYGKKVNGRELKIRLDSVNTIDDLRRVLTNKKEPFLTKLYGVGDTLFTNFMNSTMRGDFYNPYAETATIFTRAPGFAAHEVGHYTDFGASNFPFLKAQARKLILPAFSQEARASYRALDSTKDKDEKAEMRKFLFPAFGSYITGAVSPVLGIPFPSNLLLANIAGRLTANSVNTINKPKKKEPTTDKSEEKPKKKVVDK